MVVSGMSHRDLLILYNAFKRTEQLLHVHRRVWNAVKSKRLDFGVNEEI